MKEVFDGKTYYDILEIPFNAGANDIQKAYEKIKEAYSPSSPALYTIFTAAEALQLNSIIDAAFSVLSNPISRADYDRSIKKNQSSKPSTQKSADLTTDKSQNKAVGSTPNMSKTSFGPYKNDVSFEEKIKSATVYDGDFLQKIRHYKNINLEQLSEKSKISKSYILAIEAQDFSSLPAKVFVRGFVVQIAKLLNLEPDIVANSFMKIFDEAQKNS
jgi:DnaJ-class molecular chaperone